MCTLHDWFWVMGRWLGIIAWESSGHLFPFLKLQCVWEVLNTTISMFPPDIKFSDVRATKLRLPHLLVCKQNGALPNTHVTVHNRKLSSAGNSLLHYWLEGPDYYAIIIILRRYVCLSVCLSVCRLSISLYTLLT